MDSLNDPVDDFPTRFSIHQIDPLVLKNDKFGFQDMYWQTGVKIDRITGFVYIEPRPGRLLAPGARAIDPMSLPDDLTPWEAYKAQYGLPIGPRQIASDDLSTPSIASNPATIPQVSNPSNPSTASNPSTIPQVSFTPQPTSNGTDEQQPGDNAPETSASHQSGAGFDHGSLLSGRTGAPPVVQNATVKLFKYPDVGLVRMALSVDIFPPYHSYPLNPTVGLPRVGAGPAVNPVQGHLPPYTLPHHPVFLYYGRDLSVPQMPLPRRGDEPPFFVRPSPTQDWTDHGYGPGVRVNELYRAEVEHQAELATKHYLEMLVHDMNK